MSRAVCTEKNAVQQLRLLVPPNLQLVHKVFPFEDHGGDNVNNELTLLPLLLHTHTHAHAQYLSLGVNELLGTISQVIEFKLFPLAHQFIKCRLLGQCIHKYSLSLMLGMHTEREQTFT